MELSQIKMFKVVAEQGSIARASELLHCVPSNITNRIKLLESELDVELFIRTGRGLVISASGAIFLGYANDILAMCDEARRALQPDSPPSGVLKLGAIESSATGRLPALLSKYNAGCPAVRMQLSTGTWPELVTQVVEHRLDGAIIACRVEQADLECMEIYQEALVVIASAAAEGSTGPADPQGQTWFMWPAGCPYRQALEHWMHQNAVSAPITDIASYGTILGCVAAGAGMSLVPEGVFEQFKGIGNIRAHALDGLAPVQNYFISNRKSGVHRARDAFVQLIKEQLHHS